MAREMLKLRKGDSAIMIKKDGTIQMAGLDDRPLIDEKGAISPCILFSAAWAKKDQNLMMSLIENFKTCVKEGYFGPDAASDYKAMEAAAASATTTTQAASGTVTKEEWDKHKEEEKRLQAIADQGQDPKVKRQLDQLKKGAKVKSVKEFDGHRIKDPDEVANKLNEAGYKPEDGKEALDKILNDEQAVGTATIEEQPKPLQVDDAVTRRDS